MALTPFEWVYVAITVISAAYSISQAKKIRDAAKKAADARKGFEFPVEGEAINLPIVYGRAKIGGARVYHSTRGSFQMPGSTFGADFENPFDGEIDEPYGTLGTYTDPDKVFLTGLETTIDMYFTEGISGTPYANVNLTRLGILNRNLGGNRNNYLFYQQALTYGGIHAVHDIIIEESRFLDDRSLGTDNFTRLNSKEKKHLKAALRADCYYDGSQICKVASLNNPERRDAVFTDIAYTTNTFRIDRDNPQFNGVPAAQYLIEGLKVRTFTGSVLSDPAVKSYSNNPAEVLLDYLLNPIYGRGLLLEDVDIQSFADGAAVCRTTVQSNVVVAGKIWQPTDVSRNISTRNLPLYECNVILDSDKTIRDNIETILSTMGDARLIWSMGKYKLKVSYPETNAAIDVVLNITDEDIILDQSVEIAFPKASERLNHCTVRFNNEFENFKEDTASWPPKLDPSQDMTQDRYVGIGPHYYSYGTHWKNWGDGEAGRHLGNYGVWQGNNYTTTVEYLVKVDKEYVTEYGNSFELYYTMDDNGTIEVRDYETDVVIEYRTKGSPGTKTWNNLAKIDITLGDLTRTLVGGVMIATVDKIYKITITGSDETNRQEGYTVGRAVSASLGQNKHARVYWTTREPTFDAFVLRTYSNIPYRLMLAEDNNIQLETEMFAEGITDYYHALAKAEEMVRTSRGSWGIKLKYRVRTGILEPGDYITIVSENLKLGLVTPLYCIVDSVNIVDNWICELELTRFDYSFLAWNVKDDQYFSPPAIYMDEVPAPNSLLYEPSDDYANSAGRLIWDPVYYDGISAYVIYMHIPSYGFESDGFPVFREIGRTISNVFELPAILSSNFAYFGLRVFTKTNRFSHMVYANIEYNATNETWEIISTPLTRPWFNAITQDGGSWDDFPTQDDLGDLWRQNTVVSVNGVLYILTDLGNGLQWVLYNPEGLVYFLVIESSNGDVFHIGEAESTVLSPRLFKNGAEVTDQILPSWVRWRRASRIPRPFPDDDVTWDAVHISGFLTLDVDIDDIESQATFFCDIIPIAPFNAFWNNPQITASGQSSTLIHTGGSPPVTVEIEWVGDHTGLSFIRNGDTITVYEGDITPSGNSYVETAGVSEVFDAVLITGSGTSFSDNASVTEVFDPVLTPGTAYFTVSIDPVLWLENPANNTGPRDETFTVSASGGSGSFTYIWSVTGLGFSIGAGQGTTNVIIYCENDSNTTKYGTVYCIVSDGTNQVAVEAPMEVTYGALP
jgi:hypothetical protein